MGSLGDFNYTRCGYHGINMLENIESDPLLYHEFPYYYAMAIAYHVSIGDNRPEWQSDPRLWPPPPGWQMN